MSLSRPLSTAGLRAFPPEIRQMIFHFSHALSWKGKTPALIAALRGDAVLYHEVLDLFYHQNSFKLHGPNQWKTGDMSSSAIQSIQALEIEFWSSEDWEEWDSTQIIEPSLHDFHTHPITRASSCRTVRLNLSSLLDYNLKACVDPAVTCVRKLPRLQRVIVELPCISYRRADDPYDCSGCVGDLVLGMNQALGTCGRLCRVGTGGGEVWFWEGPWGCGPDR